MDKLKLCLLGTPRVEVSGKEISFPRNKGLALLCYLAVTGEIQRRDTLATLFWPESAQARGSLRKELYELKQILGDKWLILAGDTVALKQDAFWLDIDCFQKTYTSSINDGVPLADLVDAASLYRGDFLTGLTLNHCPDFDDWQSSLTEIYRQAFSKIVEQLTRKYMDAGDYNLALSQARRLLALDPLHEPAHRILMNLYAADGQFSAAIHQYEACVQMLDEEFGIPPSQETSALYKQLRNGIVFTSVSEVYTHSLVQPIIRKQHNNLPLSLTPLVGRGRELYEVGSLLNETTTRLLTIHGPGGIGKTHFAVSVANDLAKHYMDGVAFVSLAPLENRQAIWSAIAAALDLQFHTDTLPQQQLCDYLQQKSLLLVLDNFEHLTDSADLVVTLLQAAPQLKILVTSRVRLQVQEERLYPLRGLDIPDDEESGICQGDGTNSISSSSAVELFVQSVQRIQPHFKLTQQSSTQIAKICQLVAGMPLGILLASSWMDLLTPHEIAAQLEGSAPHTGFDFLQTEQGYLPDRQRSLRTVFDHSWRLLTDDERLVFRRLSVFRGGCTVEAAQEVTKASLHTLIALLHKSLLHRTQAGRLEIHELVRQYAAERLDESPADGETTQERHSAYFCAYLEHLAADLQGAQQTQALALIEADLENSLAAWSWSCQYHDLARVEQAMESLGWFYRWRSRYQEGEALFQNAVDILEGESSCESLLVHVRLLTWCAVFGQPLHPVEPIRQRFEESMALLKVATPSQPVYKSATDQPWLAAKAFLLLEMGEHRTFTDYNEAKELVSEALTFYNQLGNLWYIALSQTSLGYIHFSIGDFAGAKQQLEEALAGHRSVGNQREIARTLFYLGSLANTQGLFGEAERLTKRAQHILQRLKDRRGIADLRYDLGSIYVYTGRFVEAHHQFKEVREVYQELGDWGKYGRASDEIGFNQMHIGEYEQARANCQTAYAHCKPIDDRRGFSFALQTLGLIALAQAAWLEAHQLLKESIEILRESGAYPPMEWSVVNLGITERFLGNFEAGQQYIIDGLRNSLRYNHRLVLSWSLPIVSLLEAEAGNLTQAVELYTRALQDPHIANSQWYKDVTGTRLNKFMEQMPSAQLEAAQQKGRRLDLVQVMNAFVSREKRTA